MMAARGEKHCSEEALSAGYKFISDIIYMYRETGRESRFTKQL